MASLLSIRMRVCVTTRESGYCSWEVERQSLTRRRKSATPSTRDQRSDAAYSICGEKGTAS
jgi:hypothetical protein